MKVIIGRKAPRATTFLGRINIIPGVHAYDIEPADLAAIKADDWFKNEAKRGNIEIISGDDASEDGDKITVDAIEKIAETGSLAELEALVGGDMDKDAKAALKAAIKARKAEIAKKKKEADKDGSDNDDNDENNGSDDE
jgi:hypothetical protein